MLEEFAMLAARATAPIAAAILLSSLAACGGKATARPAGTSPLPDAAGDLPGSSYDSGAESSAVVEAGRATVDVGGAQAADAGDAADRSLEAGTEADNGAPSAVYPAPHPPLPVLTNMAGGQVLEAPRTHLVFYPGDPNEMALQNFAQKLAASSYWGATTQEYGVGALSYAGMTELTGEAPPLSITSADVQTWVGKELESGKLGTPDPQAIYTIVFPPATTITEPNPLSSILPPIRSCTGFGGYHDSVAVPPADGGAPSSFAYAVIATCSTSVDDLTAVVSHEWVEAATDPRIAATGVFTLSGGPASAYYSVDQDHLVWEVLSYGGEAGDLCQPEEPAAYITPPDVGYRVQRTWSNALAAGSHDPCAPLLAGQPFFDSAPVLGETVTFTSLLTGSITTHGVTIPVGKSKTIDVELFSDAPTSGPWTVTADDLLSKYYGKYGFTPSLSFQWDRTQGVNGETLHLTITVTTASILGGAHGFVITSTLGDRSYRWPGLIVE